MTDPIVGETRIAVVADVGRSALRLALTDEEGRVRDDTIRTFDPVSQPTVSGAISAFTRGSGLAVPPSRLAVAVSGVPRGDVVTVTNGRWRVARSGLAAMIGRAPLVLNDFAANAWAISDIDTPGGIERLAGGDIRPAAPGVYCVIGVGSGLGVALLSRNEHGSVNIIPTEAGHTSFPTGLKQADVAVDLMKARHGFASAETILSASGLLALYSAFCLEGRVTARAREASEVIRLSLQACDPVATRAVTVFGMSFWHFAANIVLAHGAWDGVIVTGALAPALRPLLGQPDKMDAFNLRGPFQRQLSAVPRGVVFALHAELRGAARALLMEDAHLSFSKHSRAV